VILVDTSIWIDHLHQSDAELADLLDASEVVVHPMVIGELSLGSIKRRREFLALLHSLKSSPVASNDEVRHLVSGRRLHGLGLSLVDAHLVASTCLDPSLRLWTRDKRLAATARRFRICHAPSPT
jgi:predicted nucleic acid-binding protein